MKAFIFGLEEIINTGEYIRVTQNNLINDSVSQINHHDIDRLIKRRPDKYSGIIKILIYCVKNKIKAYFYAVNKEDGLSSSIRETMTTTLLSICQTLNCHPNECLFFGDSVSIIESANHVGFFSIGVGHFNSACVPNINLDNLSEFNCESFLLDHSRNWY